MYKNGEQIDDSEEGFPSGTEITFDCIVSITGEQTTWKIICEDGQWIGRSMNCGMLEQKKKQHYKGVCFIEKFGLFQTTMIHFTTGFRRPMVPVCSGTTNRTW